MEPKLRAHICTNVEKKKLMALDEHNSKGAEGAAWWAASLKRWTGAFEAWSKGSGGGGANDKLSMDLESALKEFEAAVGRLVSSFASGDADGTSCDVLVQVASMLPRADAVLFDPASKRDNLKVMGKVWKGMSQILSKISSQPKKSLRTGAAWSRAFTDVIVSASLARIENATSCIARPNKNAAAPKILSYFWQRTCEILCKAPKEAGPSAEVQLRLMKAAVASYASASSADISSYMQATDSALHRDGTLVIQPDERKAIKMSKTLDGAIKAIRASCASADEFVVAIVSLLRTRRPSFATPIVAARSLRMFICGKESVTFESTTILQVVSKIFGLLQACPVFENHIEKECCVAVDVAAVCVHCRLFPFDHIASWVCSTHVSAQRFAGAYVSNLCTRACQQDERMVACKLAQAACVAASDEAARRLTKVHNPATCAETYLHPSNPRSRVFYFSRLLNDLSAVLSLDAKSAAMKVIVTFHGDPFSMLSLQKKPSRAQTACDYCSVKCISLSLILQELSGSFARFGAALISSEEVSKYLSSALFSLLGALSFISSCMFDAGRKSKLEGAQFCSLGLSLACGIRSAAFLASCTGKEGARGRIREYSFVAQKAQAFIQQAAQWLEIKSGMSELLRASSDGSVSSNDQSAMTHCAVSVMRSAIRLASPFVWTLDCRKIAAILRPVTRSLRTLRADAFDRKAVTCFAIDSALSLQGILYSCKQFKGGDAETAVRELCQSMTALFSSRSNEATNAAWPVLALTLEAMVLVRRPGIDLKHALAVSSNTHASHVPDNCRQEYVEYLQSMLESKDVAETKERFAECISDFYDERQDISRYRTAVAQFENETQRRLNACATAATTIKAPATPSPKLFQDLAQLFHSAVDACRCSSKENMSSLLVNLPEGLSNAIKRHASVQVDLSSTIQTGSGTT